jgi:hypothetical protein
VPVVRHKHHVVAVRAREPVRGRALAEIDHQRRLARGVRQQCEAELVIAVPALRVAVQLADALVRVVLDKHKVDAILHLVHVPNLV